MPVRIILFYLVSLLISRTALADFNKNINRTLLGSGWAALDKNEIYLADVKLQTADNGDWSPPTKIFDTDGILSTSAMALVADGYGNVHLFYPHAISKDDSTRIEYMYWDGQRWSFPRDIFVGPTGADLHHIRAAVDSKQDIHLTWIEGGGSLTYSHAPARVASDPHAWTTPRVIGGRSQAEASIAVGPNDQLYVAYGDTTDRGALLLLFSEDGGSTWSNPFTVAPGKSGLVYGRTSIAVDDAGRIHVAWTEHTLPSGEPLTGVYYARSLDGGHGWENPMLIDDELHGELGVGTVGEDEVHLVWRSNIGFDGTFHRWSADGGSHWSAPANYDDGGGQSGLPTFAADNSGRLHYVIGPAVYSMWSEGESSGYYDVATDEVRATADLSDGEYAILTISTGNQVHVIFETGFEAIWHTTLELDIPPIPTIVPPVPVEDTDIVDKNQGAAVTEENSTQPEIQATVDYSWNEDPPPDDSSFSIIIWGFLASAVVVTFILIFVLSRRN